MAQEINIGIHSDREMVASVVAFPLFRFLSNLILGFSVSLQEWVIIENSQYVESWVCLLVGVLHSTLSFSVNNTPTLVELAL